MPINFNHVFFTYSPGSPFKYEAIKDVSLHIEDHSFTAIIGQTGSGKSTLVQQINALLLPTDGFVEVNGIAVTPTKYKKYLKKLTKIAKSKKSSDELKKQINSQIADLKLAKPLKVKQLRAIAGMVFQFPEYQLFEDTVLKDVAFGPQNFGVSKEDATSKAKIALEKVGLDESYHSRSPFDLSGGEKRRVAIAGILALEPSILVLDEPTAGLDPLSSKTIMELFSQIHQGGTTIVLVTHNMDIVLKYATKVVVMKEGSIIEEKAPQELFGNIKEEYSLEVPLIYEFVSKLKNKGLNLDGSKIHDENDLIQQILMSKKGENK